MNETIECIHNCFKEQIAEKGLEAGKDIAISYWFQSAGIIIISAFFFLWIIIMTFFKAVASKKANKTSKSIFVMHILIPFIIYIIAISIYIIMLPKLNLWLFT